MNLLDQFQFEYKKVVFPMIFYPGDTVVVFNTNGGENIYPQKTVTFIKRWEVKEGMETFQVYDKLNRKYNFFIFFTKPIDGYDGFIIQ